MSAKRVQGRWKNVALTVYLICPLALVTGLCVWIMVSLQQRVENAGRMRSVPAQQDIAPESPSVEAAEDATKSEEGDKATGNSAEERSESWG